MTAVPSAPWPAWLDRAAVYEIYPQSFQDSDGDGIGDIPGIIRRLDYIRSLGCTVVWLNPCFLSPFGDAGYDVADFRQVAPRYGTNQDLAALFAEAHRRGMRVLLDLVAGHTSVQHPWFIEACRAERGPRSDWYVFTDSVWEPQPGESRHRFIQGYGERNGSYLANYFWFQPALNYGFSDPDPARPWQQPVDAPGPQAVRRELREIMRFWLEQGCDGFRVDMAPFLVKRSAGGHDAVASAGIWREIRAWLDRAWPEAALISEWSEPEQAIAAGFHADFLIHYHNQAFNRLRGTAWSGDPADGAFLRRTGGDVAGFLAGFLPAYERTSGRGLVSVPTGNHDVHRLSRLIAPADLRVAYALLFTLPGLPVVYYGDEIGLRNQTGLASKEGGYERTAARTPMQWDGSANAGFSTAPAAALHLPIDSAADRPTVAGQEADPASLLQLVRRLLRLRQDWPSLGNRAGFTALVTSGRAFAFRRGADALVVVNPSGTAIELAFALPGVATARPELAEGAAVRIGTGVAIATADACSWGIFRLE